MGVLLPSLPLLPALSSSSTVGTGVSQVGVPAAFVGRTGRSRAAGLTAAESKLTCRPPAPDGAAAVAAGVAPTSNRSCLMVLSAAADAVGWRCTVGRPAAEASPAAGAAAPRPLVVEKLRRFRMDLRLPPAPLVVAGAAPPAAAEAATANGGGSGCLSPGVKPSRLGKRTARAVRPVRLGVWVRRGALGFGSASAAAAATEVLAALPAKQRGMVRWYPPATVHSFLVRRLTYCGTSPVRLTAAASGAAGGAAADAASMTCVKAAGSRKDKCTLSYL